MKSTGREEVAALRHFYITEFALFFRAVVSVCRYIY